MNRNGVFLRKSEEMRSPRELRGIRDPGFVLIHVVLQLT